MRVVMEGYRADIVRVEGGGFWGWFDQGGWWR